MRIDRGELLGVQQRALGRAAGHQHQELRLAEAGQRVLSGHRLLQAAGGFAQHLVADLQSERGVDVAQVRDLEEQQRRAAGWVRAALIRLLESRASAARGSADCVSGSCRRDR